MINYCEIELYKTAYDRDIPKMAMMLEDGGGNFRIPPAREAGMQGWVCALLPPVIGRGRASASGKTGQVHSLEK